MMRVKHSCPNLFQSYLCLIQILIFSWIKGIFHESKTHKINGLGKIIS